MVRKPEGVGQGGALVSRALELHARYRGKIQIMPKVPVRSFDDFGMWYTPGVADPCRAIAQAPDEADIYTNRANTIVVLSDGSRVLGLGDIGPEAGLPVMEGKALLFKLLGGVDAVPLCIRAREPEDLVRAAELIEPSFGGINLEDIAQPKCFRILDRLRQRLKIPVWHDDQQGTATVALAGLLAALERVGKAPESVRIVLFGAGAANVATYRLLVSGGFDPRRIVVCDSQGVLHPGRTDIEERQESFIEKWMICRESNGDELQGGPDTALRGADVCIAFSRSGPGVIRSEWLAAMARDSILFACANPVPEIMPDEAKAAGVRIVATGRSDFPNQVNNCLAFPGVFRGVLDVMARTVTDRMAIAAAREIAAVAREGGLRDDRIVPPIDDVEVAVRVAAATGTAAILEGLARCPLSYEELQSSARERIVGARDALDRLLPETASD